MTAEVNQRPVCIVGLGARTAVGASVAASAAAVRAGLSMFHDHPFMIDKSGSRMVVAGDTFLPEDMLDAERFATLGGSAAEEALIAVGRLGGPRESMQVLLGLPPERPGLPFRLADSLAKTMNEVLASARAARRGSVQVFNSGHSAGLMALEEAWRKIRAGATDLCLVGGIDTYLLPETLEWLDHADRLHSEANTWGFIPGEAAGFCLLASFESCRRFGFDVMGTLLSIVTTQEPVTVHERDRVCLGEGLTEAFRNVLKALPSEEEQVNGMICDMNGEQYRADEFGYTVVRTGRRFVDASDFLTPADCWGDVGAASGPLFAALALTASAKGYAKGPYTLLWTSSDAGQRCAALVRGGNPISE